MKIAIGCDPNAQQAKEELIKFMEDKGYGEIKVKGAYAALLSDIYSAKRARLSNDANIACMGAFTIGNKLREELTDAFLTNEFVPGCSSQPKVDAFREYEAAHQK